MERGRFVLRVYDDSNIVIRILSLGVSKEVGVGEVRFFWRKIFLIEVLW